MRIKLKRWRPSLTRRVTIAPQSLKAQLHGLNKAATKIHFEEGSPVPQDARKFMTTQWTHVMAARGESEEARACLRALCERYYVPVQMFIHSYTQDHPNSQDWTQSFFAKLLEGSSLDSVMRSKGKFRSYLLGAVKHFLSDERAKLVAQKRGGRVDHQLLEAADRQMQPNDLAALDAQFDRQWALSILQASLQDLESELNKSQRERFALLRPWLSGEPSDLSLADVQAQLGLSTETIKVTLHRWRKRFREIVRAHIASTLSDLSHLEDELRYLVDVLGKTSM